MKQEAATILTLDAGGTNFVFSALQAYKEVGPSLRVPANTSDLDECLTTIIEGFEKLGSGLESFDAISFAFPGPADYKNGILGDLPNFEAFNGDFPLGPILEEHFKVPVFINNDGNLFALGVALQGYLAEINRELRNKGSHNQYRNLIGITLGTGFGCGIIVNDQLLLGDNGCGGEIHNTLNVNSADWNAEATVSTEAIRRVYANESGEPTDPSLMPKDIYDIAKGTQPGSKKAALESFSQYGKSLGSSIANILTIIDGLVVIGGGLSAGWDLFAPSMFYELNRPLKSVSGDPINRLSYKVFNLEDPEQLSTFLIGEPHEITIGNSGRKVNFDRMPRTGVALSKQDTSQVIAFGAYAYADQQLNRR